MTEPPTTAPDHDPFYAFDAEDRERFDRLRTTLYGDYEDFADLEALRAEPPLAMRWQDAPVAVLNPALVLLPHLDTLGVHRVGDVLRLSHLNVACREGISKDAAACYIMLSQSAHRLVEGTPGEYHAEAPG